jgi:hypothetical protein
MFDRIRSLPRTIWALGLVSMFMDISSEMIHSLLPVFLVTALGASPALVGLIEGLGEATASITKVFSGWLTGSVTGVLIGVALWGLHLGLTQGLLAALVADTAPARLRGTAFGLFNLATGATTLAASVLAGAIWSGWGASLTFLTGGGLALTALVGALVLPKEKRTDAGARA